MSNILGVSFSNSNMMVTIRTLDNLLEEKNKTPFKPLHIVTANPEIVMKGTENPEFLKILNEADIVTPDGIGIVIASKITQQDINERVTGFDLVINLLQARNVERKKTTVYALGAKEDVIKLAMRNLRQRFSEIEFIGYHHGYFESNSKEEEAIVKDIQSKEPDILLVGLGSPRQEEFIYKYKSNLNAKISIGCGGTFDVLSGKIKRAPKFMQKIGLEWFYRLLKEPKRLKRQLVIPKFLFKVICSKTGA